MPSSTRCGIAFEHAAVHERARVAFVGVADHVLDAAAVRLGHRAPLQAGGVARPAAPAQAALDDLVDHLHRRHLGQRIQQGGVAVLRDVVLDPLRIDAAGVLEHDLLLANEKRRRGVAVKALDNRILLDALHDLSRVVGRDVAIEDALGLRFHQRARRAQPHAADALYLAALARGFRQGFFHLIGAGGDAARRRAHV